MNPRRRRRRRRSVRRKRSYAFNFPRRRRRRSRRVASFATPRRRRHRRRSRNRRYSGYRSNPPALRSVAGEIGWGTAGFLTTKVVGNLAAPMLGGLGGDQPVIRIGIKFGIAYVSAWALSSFMGSRVFMPAMLGGSIEAIQDAVKSFIAPTFPMLAANYEPLGTYYEPAFLPPSRGGLAEYMGDGLSPDHDVLV